MNCNLRPMEAKDLPLTFAWRNEDTIRNMAQTNQVISYNEHDATFRFNNALKLVFEIDSIPVGYVSCTYDADNGGVGEWGFHLAPEARKKGYSEIMLKMAMIYLKKQGYSVVHALVKESNLPSLYLHRKLGFKPGTSTMPGFSFYEKAL